LEGGPARVEEWGVGSKRRISDEIWTHAVILDEPGPSIALTALRGTGSIGKTILAQALSHDQVVQQAFPDGSGWIGA
jgi:hypothetical protein